MKVDRPGTMTRQLRTLLHVGAVAGLTNEQLLELFAARSGESAELAFAALVERHGPMVHRVCSRLLGGQQDADDAFQATFLILARRAGAIRRRDSVGPWLFGVALRVATCDRAARNKRRLREQRFADRKLADRERRTAGAEDRSELAREVLKVDETDPEGISDGLTTVRVRREKVVEGRLIMPEGAKPEGILVSGFGFGPKTNNGPRKS